MNHRDFVLHLWNIYKDELTERLAEFQEKHHTLITTSIKAAKNEDGSKAGGSTGLPDCLYLYLLIRHFKPKTIFEIGTWIGTSGMFMAEALKKNAEGNGEGSRGGHIYTCDINNAYALSNEYDQFITRMNVMSDEALAELPHELKVDFMFADGELTPATIKELTKRVHTNTVLATHDFKLPGEKGVRNLVKLQRAFANRYKYVLPTKKKVHTIAQINSSVGLLVPQQHPVKKRSAGWCVTYQTAALYALSTAYRFYRKARNVLR